MASLGLMIRRTALYSLGIIAARLGSLITLPIVTRVLSPADYGVIELISTSYWVAEVLLGGSFAEALPFFYVKAQQDAKSQVGVLRTAASGGMLLGLGGMLAGLLASPLLSELVFRSPAYSQHFQITFLGFSGSLTYSALINYLRIEDRAQAITILGLARLVLNVVLCILLVKVWPLKEIGVLLSGSLTSVVCGLGAIGYLIKRHGLGFSWSEFRQQFSYALPLSLSGLMMIAIHFGDRFFLQRSTNLNDIGLYSFAYKLGMMVSIAHGPFLFYWQGQMFHEAQSSDGQRMTARVLTGVTLGLTLAGMAICLFAQPLIAVLAPASYAGAALLAPGIVLAYILRGMTDQLRGVFNTSAKTWEQSSVSLVGAVVSLSLYAALIPLYGSMGAVVATLCSFLIMLLFSIWRVHVVAPHDWEWKKIALIMSLGGVVVAAFWVAMPTGLVLQIAWGSFGLILFIAAILVSPVLDNHEKQRLRQMAERSLSWKRM
jgi:O-antigen/teichoic acid export membrane protein